jgi:hypothetical protein
MLRLVLRSEFPMSPAAKSGFTPAHLAQRMARDRNKRAAATPPQPGGFKRETFSLPREAARSKAREMLRQFPKAAYMTEIESWRVLPGDVIEFTMRRLPSAD